MTKKLSNLLLDNELGLLLFIPNHTIKNFLIPPDDRIPSELKRSWSHKSTNRNDKGDVEYSRPF